MRVPALIEVEDIADDVVAASITDMTGLGVDLSVGSRGNGQLLSGKRSLESQIKALDKRSEPSGDSGGRFCPNTIWKNYCSIRWICAIPNRVI